MRLIAEYRACEKSNYVDWGAKASSASSPMARMPNDPSAATAATAATAPAHTTY